VTRLTNGEPTRKIADLEQVSQSGVAKIKMKLASTLDLKDLPRSGRPRILTERDERKIVREIVSNSAQTAVDVQKNLKHNDLLEISTQTVRRALRRNGLRARIKRKKPLLSKNHRKQRLEFAKKHKDWKEEDWARVVWSDESKFQLFGSDGKQYCWVKPSDQIDPRSVQPTVKHGGGNIMVWGCITWSGIGFMCRIENIMDAAQYRTILDTCLMPSMDWYKMKKEEVVFQHDNDPKHTSKLVQKWLSENEINVMKWPAQSPDLNPIEHIWNEVDRRLRKLPGKISSKEDLWDKLQDAWNDLKEDDCRKLIKTMPERVRDIIKAKGGYTRW